MCRGSVLEVKEQRQFAGPSRASEVIMLSFLGVTRLSLIIFSSILPAADVKLMRLYFKAALLSPSWKIGVTLASCQGSGALCNHTS